jgi:hypothetical protein
MGKGFWFEGVDGIGTFAALRMTAKTNNVRGKQRQTGSGMAPATGTASPTTAER